MSIKEQIEIVKLLRADMNELNGGYQTNVVMANKKADELINHLQQVKNNDSLHSVSKCACPPLVACEICGEEKNLDGDFWKNKKKHDC